MKNLFNLSILAICSMIILGLSSCEHQEVMNEAMGPQFSDGPTVDDLDLSEGFRGTYGSTPGGDYDFAIRNHDPMYPFIQGRGDKDLDGVCTIEIEFQLNGSNPTLDVTQLSVSDLLLTYNNGNGLIEQPAAYTWLYPYLEIQTVYTNSLLNYDVAFANSLGGGISIADVVVTGGLCVIQNIDHSDPITQINF